jgi:hypothetical protein
MFSISDALKAKLWSIAKGALVAAAGAVLYYVATYLASPDAVLDFGPAIVAILSVLINAARKALEPDKPVA